MHGQSSPDPVAPAARPITHVRRHEDRVRLREAYEALHRELSVYLRPTVLDELLEAAWSTATTRPEGDPAVQLRSVVGQRLLDEVAGVLRRATARVDRSCGPPGPHGAPTVEGVALPEDAGLGPAEETRDVRLPTRARLDDPRPEGRSRRRRAG